MTSPDERADNRARNDAIELVDNALKSGRIVQADRDMRVDQLRRAQTMQEIDLQVRDLKAPATGVTSQVPAMSTVSVGGNAPGTHNHPWPLVSYGPGSTGSAEAAEIARAVSKGGKAIGGIIAFIVVLSVIVPIAGAAIAFFAARDSFPDFGDIGPTDDTTYLPGQTPGEDGVNVHTVEGYEAMVEALEEETGKTYTFTTSIFPRYAVLQVPTGVNDRYQSFYWDGRTLELNESKGTSGEDQVDLSLVDPQQLVDMLTTVRGRMDNPEYWYAIISDYENLDPQITAYASNDYGESTYIVATLDGTVIYDSDNQLVPEEATTPTASASP